MVGSKRLATLLAGGLMASVLGSSASSWRSRCIRAIRNAQPTLMSPLVASVVIEETESQEPGAAIEALPEPPGPSGEQSVAEYSWGARVAVVAPCAKDQNQRSREVGEVGRTALRLLKCRQRAREAGW